MVVRRKIMNAPRLNAIKTRCPRGHDYTAENTLWSTNHNHGGKMRQCRECKRIREQGRVRKRPAHAPTSDDRS